MKTCHGSAFTQDVNVGRRLGVSQRKRCNFADVGSDICEASSGNGNGGISYGGGHERHASLVLLGDGDAELGVENREGDGAGGETALPGGLSEAEVGAHFDDAAQSDVLPQHRVHSVLNGHLVAAYNC